MATTLSASSGAPALRGGATTEHRHDDEHEHGPGDGHEHRHFPVQPHVHQRGQLGHGAPVLDIGGDIGALVLYTGPELEGVEIDVSLLDGPERRTHTEVLRRTVGGTTFWAGVYAALPEGDYQTWYDDAPVDRRRFSVRGGAVTELDWR